MEVDSVALAVRRVGVVPSFASMMAARPPAGIRNKKGVFGRFQHHPKQ